ncbi:MAG: cytochrome-c peroxidase [Cyclobacteriaceae bacterium]|nr:cytochrome-c peroxidase [Cyclobacteriaceae bacterium]
MKSLRTSHYILLGIALVFVNCGGGTEKNAGRKNQAQEYAENTKLEKEIGQRARSMFQPLPALAENPANPVTPEKVALGKQLYFDNRLSRDETQSCNTCHDLAAFGVDHKRFSPGDAGMDGDRNSPTVYNSALHSMQFWDGRAKDVEEQAGMPILESDEMNIPDEGFLIRRLKTVEGYRKMFAAAFPDDPDPVSFENLKKAIGAFERTLITTSNFDDYLKGNQGALTVAEKKGLKAFMDVGCVTCHTGSLLGANMFQKFGVFHNYWEYTKSETVDEGRAKETGNEPDKYMFKVPALRMVSNTYPYFHDGSVESIEDAIRIISKLNLDRDLTDEEVVDIAVFLNTMTGEIPSEFSRAPDPI